MANGNKNSFNFNIPVGIIVLSFFVSPPIGVVLVILRAISEAYKSSGKTTASSSSAASPSVAPSVSSPSAGNRASQRTARRKKASAAHADPGKPLKIAGSILLALSAVIGIASLGSLVYVSLADLIAGFLPPIALTLVSGAACIAGGVWKQKRSVRFARIRAIIGEHETFNLSRLAAASGTGLAQTRRDLQRLIDSGEFGKQAYIDLGTNNFMRHPEAKPEEIGKFDYKNVYGDLFKGKKNKNGEPEAEENLGIDSDNDDFKTIIREIRRLNDEIKDDVVSEKIFKIEAHTKNIFEYVSAHPEAMPMIRTFLNYYLPTTLKLLESYSRIEKIGVAGDNMKKSKESIENMLDMLENAFKIQIDELFKNESIDISSDISVLETMMKKDGLNSKGDFDFSGFTDEISDDTALGGGAAAKKEE